LEIHISYNEDIKYRDVKIEGFGEKYKEMEAIIEKEK
jgi:tRNA threonylcarbamoyladenosine biosynthesis protein TsaE